MYITNKIGIIIALCCATFMGVAVYISDHQALAMCLTASSSIVAAVIANTAPDNEEIQDRNNEKN